MCSLSLSVPLSVSLSPPPSLCLSLCLCLSLGVSLSVCLSLALSLSLSVSMCVSLCLCLSLCVSMCVSLCLCVSLSLKLLATGSPGRPPPLSYSPRAPNPLLMVDRHPYLYVRTIPAYRPFLVKQTAHGVYKDLPSLLPAYLLHPLPTTHPPSQIENNRGKRYNVLLPTRYK